MENLNQFILFMPVLLFSVVAHEYAHGYAALKQGDPTALQLGRLTFNPIKHIDPFMTILLPAVMWFTAGFMFGGAKPVPVNPRNYKRFKQGDIIVSMAGIATNVVLGFCAALLIVILGAVANIIGGSEIIGLIQYMLILGIRINFILAMFNLLPIPPLDGSHVMKYILPPAWSLRYQAIGGAGLLILIVILVFFEDLLWTWMSPAMALANMLILAVVPYLQRSTLIP